MIQRQFKHTATRAAVASVGATVIDMSADVRMNNIDTIILRGQNDMRHYRERYGSFEGEIEALTRISGPSCKPRIRTKDDYHALRGELALRLKEEVRAVTEQYAPTVVRKSRRPEYI